MSGTVTRWLLTGAGGMLGRDLSATLAGHPGIDLTGLTRAELDLTGDVEELGRAVAGQRIVINAAGWTDVDGAEAHEQEATEVNGHGVERLARACGRAGAILIHVSSDYVFSGTARSPYPEDWPTEPVNAYGRGKVVGERAVTRRLPDTGYVVRTAWLYGEHGRNFVTTMLRMATARDQVEVVTDQRGQPTWTRALARRLLELGLGALAGRAPAGVYHGTASGQTTWYGLAREVFRLAGLDPDRVRPARGDQASRPARRPTYSVLGHDRWAAAGLAPLPHWRPMLAEALARPGFGVHGFGVHTRHPAEPCRGPGPPSSRRPSEPNSVP